MISLFFIIPFSSYVGKIKDILIIVIKDRLINLKKFYLMEIILGIKITYAEQENQEVYLMLLL